MLVVGAEVEGRRVEASESDSDSSSETAASESEASSRSRANEAWARGEEAGYEWLIDATRWIELIILGGVGIWWAGFCEREIGKNLGAGLGDEAGYRTA